MLGFLFGNWRSGCGSPNATCLCEIHLGSLWEMGSWCQHSTLPGRALQRLKRTILAAFPFKRGFSETVSLLIKVSVPLPSRQAGALRTIEECGGKILWIAQSSQ